MRLQIVFSKAWWVGRKVENPEEKQLPMPLALQQDKQHEAYDYDYGAGSHVAAADGGGEGPSKSSPAGAAAAAGGSAPGLSPGAEVMLLDGEDEPEVSGAVTAIKKIFSALQACAQIHAVNTRSQEIDVVYAYCMPQCGINGLLRPLLLLLLFSLMAQTNAPCYSSACMVG